MVTANGHMHRRHPVLYCGRIVMQVWLLPLYADTNWASGFAGPVQWGVSGPYLVRYLPPYDRFGEEGHMDSHTGNPFSPLGGVLRRLLHKSRPHHPCVVLWVYVMGGVFIDGAYRMVLIRDIPAFTAREIDSPTCSGVIERWQSHERTSSTLFLFQVAFKLGTQRILNAGD